VGTRTSTHLFKARACLVSIQLVSPASGDPWRSRPPSCPHGRFHSISFPSEWGLYPGSPLPKPRLPLVSIQLVSPASGDWVLIDFAFSSWGEGFHSISFPSEWGLPKDLEDRADILVSIQLVSPASGDMCFI